MKIARRIFFSLIALSCLAVAFVYWFITQPILSSPDDLTPVVSVPESQLRHHVTVLSKTLPNRSDDVDQLNQSAHYIFNELSKYGKPYFQEFQVWGITYKNVVLRLGPENGTLMIIGAHYDSAGGLPGADDNASGVSGLIELSRLLASTNLEAPVEIVAYALEEPPYFGTHDMGSYYHAQQLQLNKVAVKLMISIEMIGYFSDVEGSQDYPLSVLKYLYPSKGNFIACVGSLNDTKVVRNFKKGFASATHLPIISLNAPPFLPGVNFSDHANYWHHGYNAVMITDTAFFRNKNYHTLEDTEEKLDYEKMAEVVKGIYSAVILFAH